LAGISPSALWEYRRGHFPLPLRLLRRLCQIAGVDPAVAEPVWHAAERQRLLGRGYPEALAELKVLCLRAGQAGPCPPRRRVGPSAGRPLRYLEVPPWEGVAAAARTLCRDEQELLALRRLWARGEAEQRGRPRDGFGPAVRRLRQEQGFSRRQLADLFGVR